MSKRLLALLLAVLMAAMAMTGCAKNETPSGGGDAEGEVIELDFWIIGNYPDEKDYYLAKILEDFNETHDNIHLNITGMRRWRTSGPWRARTTSFPTCSRSIPAVR